MFLEILLSCDKFIVIMQALKENFVVRCTLEILMRCALKDSWWWWSRSTIFYSANVAQEYM